jgi:hypothetical protein
MKKKRKKGSIKVIGTNEPGNTDVLVVWFLNKAHGEAIDAHATLYAKLKDECEDAALTGETFYAVDAMLALTKSRDKVRELREQLKIAISRLPGDCTKLDDTNPEGDMVEVIVRGFLFDMQELEHA